DVTEITEDEARDVRMLVREQLAAFRAGDAQRAWSLCSPNIHAAFETPTAMMELIRTRYRPLLVSRALRFGAWTLTPEGIGLGLDLADDHGQSHYALFLVLKDRGGGWRINGALLLDGVEEGLAEAA